MAEQTPDTSRPLWYMGAGGLRTVGHGGCYGGCYDGSSADSTDSGAGPT